MRDHRKLRVFEKADALWVRVYEATAEVPKHEWYGGIRSQIRRAALSVPTNIVEGCRRESTAEYRRFMNIAEGSAAEVCFLLSACKRLNYVEQDAAGELQVEYDGLAAGLRSLCKNVGR